MDGSVLPNRFVLGYTFPYPGSVSELTTFQGNEELQDYETRETDIEKGYDDDLGELTSEYPERRNFLGNKGYQGGTELMPVLHSKKKTPMGISRDQIFKEMQRFH